MDEFIVKFRGRILCRMCGVPAGFAVGYGESFCKLRQLDGDKLNVITKNDMLIRMKRIRLSDNFENEYVYANIINAENTIVDA